MLSLARSGRAVLPAPRHLEAHVPNHREPNLRLHRRAQLLAATFLVLPFSPRLGPRAISKVGCGESFFILLRSWHGQARAIDRQCEEFSLPPIRAAYLFHQPP